MRYIHAGPSKQALLVRTFARTVIRPALAYYPTHRTVLRTMHAVELAARVQLRHRDVTVERVRGEHWAAELVTPRGVQPGTGAIVYYHGGAFLFCGTATHRHVVEQLALRTGVPVLSVDYRQNHRGKVADAVEDGLAAVDWLIERGFDPSQLLLAGDSAGGHLSFAVTTALRDVGLQVAGVVGLSPWLDFDNAMRREGPNARRDHYIPVRRLDAIAQLVTGRPIIEPSLSPVNASLRGFPPALLMCAADEVLRHDSELMATRLHKAGVPVDLHIWQGQVHAFPVLGQLVPEASAAIDLVAEFAREQVGASGFTSVEHLAG